MPWFDVALIVIIVLFGLFGFWFGVVQMFGSLLGMVLSIFLASRFYEPLAVWLSQLTAWSGNFPRVVMFVIAFVVINRLIGFVFWIVTKALNLITRLPFLNSLNRILGLGLGVLEGALTVGVALYFIDRFPLAHYIMGAMANSRFAPTLIHIATIFLPFIPEAIRILTTTVVFVEHTIRNW